LIHPPKPLLVEGRTEQSSLQEDLVVWVLVGLALVLLSVPLYSFFVGGL
jgi:hypothetical protein